MIRLRAATGRVRKILMKAVLQRYYNVVGYNVECNICGWKDKRFSSDNWHPYTICPYCYSQVRQRLFWAIVNHNDEFNLQEMIKNKKVLHFAPEVILGIHLLRLSGEYHTADLLTDGYKCSHIDHYLDISDMHTIKDQEYDCVIAFDVLEHVPDHLKAMEEIFRVLCIGGVCILTVPQKDGLQLTYEDLTNLDAKEREEKFGQSDHLRVYGDDFTKMLKSKGFEVKAVDEKCFDQDMIERNVLFPPILSDRPLATNYRKVFFGVKV